MNKKQVVSAVISMSLDGYIAGENVGADEPLGVGGLSLHEWMVDGSAETDKVFAESGASLGAVVCGRLTYDLSIPWWKENGPTGEARIPVIVISDEEPDNILPCAVYTFVKDEDAAFETAKKVAQGKDISVMGGAKTIQKFLNKNYIDEIQIQLIPIILGGGKRLFDNMNKQMKLKPFKTLSSENAIHLGFSVE
ncbi:MAG: dihydrofolate reductase family protein [Leptotrichiaceae bacterium]|nr:dihydrofolate reductase family protein [Leptotrichiaceae bacterium]